jgi:hypothetical protein
MLLLLESPNHLAPPQAGFSLRHSFPAIQITFDNHPFSPFAHRGGRVIGTDTLRISLVLHVSSDGQAGMTGRLTIQEKGEDADRGLDGGSAEPTYQKARCSPGQCCPGDRFSHAQRRQAGAGAIHGQLSERVLVRNGAAVAPR